MEPDFHLPIPIFPNIVDVYFYAKFYEDICFLYKQLNNK